MIRSCKLEKNPGHVYTACIKEPLVVDGFCRVNGAVLLSGCNAAERSRACIPKGMPVWPEKQINWDIKGCDELQSTHQNFQKRKLLCMSYSRYNAMAGVQNWIWIQIAAQPECLLLSPFQLLSVQLNMVSPCWQGLLWVSPTGEQTQPAGTWCWLLRAAVPGDLLWWSGCCSDVIRGYQNGGKTAAAQLMGC